MENALPEGIGENGDAIAPFDTVVGEEGPAEQGRDPEDVKEIGIRRDHPD